jgi:hypothetical protein
MTLTFDWSPGPGAADGARVLGSEAASGYAADRELEGAGHGPS